MSLLYAFIVRDLAIEKKYRFHFAVKSFDVFFHLAIFYFLSRLISQEAYFPFVFIGLVFSRFFHFWLTTFSETLRQEQYWGTIEPVFLSPRHPFAVVLSSAGGKFLLLVFELLLYIVFGIFVFKADISARFPAVLPYLFMSGILFAGFGLVSASFILYFKRGDPVNWLVANVFDLLSGVYFPIALLPPGIRPVADVLPTTLALNGWRRVLIYGEGFSPGRDFLVLSLWAASLMVLAVIAFRMAYRHARTKGELGSY